jgi:L-lactate dehydrogenase complex protein LldF
MNAAARILHLLGKRRGRLSRLPLASGWTRGRDLPVPQGATFHSQWQAGNHP